MGFPLQRDHYNDQNACCRGCGEVAGVNHSETLITIADRCSEKVTAVVDDERKN
ncbi:hypothetical protein HAX54_002671, partial [Datura stramonium]|nr:hypothetical protein [Datura stramonium]